MRASDHAASDDAAVDRSALVVEQPPGVRAGRVLAGLGSFWGLALASVFIPVAHFLLVPAFLLAGVTACGIPFYAASWLIFAVYAAAIGAPFTYVLATFGNRLFTELAFLVPLFCLINVAIAPLAIIGVLLGLLLPAVQSTREAARTAAEATSTAPRSAASTSSR